MEGRGKVELPMLEVSAGPPAQSYIAAARRFFLGVEVLSRGDSSLSPACAYLAAQSAECALKSFLSKSGMTEKELKDQKLRHNLESLWTKAVAHGLSVPPEPPSWCVVLNQTHDNPYYLRYPIGINGFQTPPFEPMVTELRQLIAAVQTAV